jgi:hypothetical protein
MCDAEAAAMSALESAQSATVISPLEPGLCAVLDADPMDCADMEVLKSNVSTATGYLDSEALPKVSLWDLRADLKAALEGAAENVDMVEVPRSTIARMLEVMREHVGHRQVERTLRKDCKVRGWRFVMRCLWRCPQPMSALACGPRKAAPSAAAPGQHKAQQPVGDSHAQMALV